jgi:hypothetical protein
MGKLTEEIFNESCCDGGACNTSMSAQSCGCDRGANWMCERHKAEHAAKLLIEQALTGPQQRTFDWDLTPDQPTDTDIDSSLRYERD